MTSLLSDRDYLFVYGTLRQDANNQMSHILALYADFVGKGTFHGKLYDVDEYPGAVPSNETSDVIQGEVYALRDRDRVLRVLDEYEGCGPDEPLPTEFRRERMTVFLENGEKVQAWIYIYNRPTNGLTPILSGNYLEFTEQKICGPSYDKMVSHL